MHTRPATTLDLFTDSVRLMGDATLCAVMEFDRRLDIRALEHAQQACLLAHPILHSRLVRGNGPAHWEMAQPEKGSCIPVTQCIGNYHRHVIGPVNPYDSRQFRVRLVQRPSGDIIIINLAHAAADGFGLFTLMSQLLQEYKNPGSIPPSEAGIAERDTVWSRRLVQEETSSLPDMRVIDPLWPDPFWTSHAPSSYHRECINPYELDAVRKEAKTFGGNMNDVILAAYFLAMSDLTGHQGPIDLFFPVNLRQHLGDGSRVMSNQATNVSFPFRRRTGEGMEEILIQIIQKTQALKANRIGIAEQVEMDRASDPEGRQIHQMVEQMATLQKEGLTDIFVSNPGPLVLPDVEGLTDAYICYPGVYMPTTCFVTSTFRERMTITMGYQDSKRAREGTRKAMQLFRKHFLSLVDDR